MINRSRLLLPTVVFLGVASLALLGFFVFKGVEKPQNAVPSKAAGGDPAKCQGNLHPSPKCFDCKKDTGRSQINQLDFAGCFKKVYGQTVGKP